MSKLGALVAELHAAGVTGDALVRVLDRMSDVIDGVQRGSAADTTAEKRRSYDRKRKREKKAERDGIPPENSTGIPPEIPPMRDHSTPTSRSQDAAHPSNKKPASDFPPDAFGQFWQRYPHRVGKGEAERSFERIRRKGDVTFAALTDGVDRYVRTKPPDRPWCNPSTWLNQARWTDQPADTAAFAGPAHRPKPTGDPDATSVHAAGQRLLERALEHERLQAERGDGGRHENVRLLAQG